MEKEANNLSDIRKFFENKAITYLLCAIASLCIIVASVILSVEKNITDEAFFTNEYIKCRVDIDLGMDMKDIEMVSREMMKYLYGQREDLVVYTTLRGTYREFFNDREKAHMVDVKAMLDTAIAVRTACLVAAFLAIEMVIWTRRKKAWGYLARTYLWVCAATAAFFGFICLFIVMNGFTEFWERFHGVFFTNDLWLLNPATDMMILLLPEQFFFDLVFQSLMVFGIICGVLIILSLIKVVADRGAKA